MPPVHRDDDWHNRKFPDNQEGRDPEEYWMDSAAGQPVMDGGGAKSGQDDDARRDKCRCPQIGPPAHEDAREMQERYVDRKDH
jgi:hypothetical protein